MVTFAQAQERAELWINGDVPGYQQREVRVREFDLGFVAWAADREGGPVSDHPAEGARLVIARDGGETTLWPALPVGEVIRRYEEVYGAVDESEEGPADAPPQRIDLNATSFLLTPPEWLQEAADAMGIPDRRSGAADAAGPRGDGRPAGVPGAGSADEPSGAAAGYGGAPEGGPGAGDSFAPGAGDPFATGQGSRAQSAGPEESSPWAPPAPAADLGGSTGAGAPGGAPAPDGSSGGRAAWEKPFAPPGTPDPAGATPPVAPVGATPWTDANTGGGDGDRSVAPPATVFAPPLAGSDDEDTPAPGVRPDAKTELMSAGSALPPTAIAPAFGLSGAGGEAPDASGGPANQAPGGPVPPGAPGMPGGPGMPGAPGMPGPPGAPGAPGAAAVPPAPGVPAPPGAPGSPGGAGVPGAAASRTPGVPGPPGPPGPPGAPGGAGPNPAPPSGPGAPGAPAGGYVPTQLVSALDAESLGGVPLSGAPGPDAPPPAAPGAPGGGVHAAATMLAGPAGPGQSGQLGPLPPNAPGAPGGPGAPGMPGVPGQGPQPPAGHGAGVPGAPPPGAPGAPGGVHAAATMLAGAPGAPGMPGAPGGPGMPGGAQPPGAPGPVNPGPHTPPLVPPGTPPPGMHAAATMLAGAPGAPGAPMAPGMPGVPGQPGMSAPGMPGAPGVPGQPGPGMAGGPGMPGAPGGQPYGYPQAPSGLPTVGPGYMAVLRYRAQDGSEQQLIRRSAPGTPHPEWQILHELRAMNVPPQQVLELHTELESCDLPGGYCARMIRESWPQVRISHTAPYGRDHATRQQGVRHLIEHQGELHQVADGPARPAPNRVPLPHPSQVQRVPPAPVEAVAQELVGAFGPQGVFRFDQRAVSRMGVPEVVAQTLVWVGLPLDFGPFFWAQAQPGRPVPTLAELAAERGVQPAADAGSYLVMGNDFGRQLCVQYGTANIVAVPVEAGPGGQPVPPQFVNTGLPEFVRCMALLGRMWRLRYGLTPEQAGRWTVDFQAQLAALDPAALAAPDNWWAVLLEQMWDGLL